MPTLLNEAGLRFFFWSNEGEPLERPHVHVEAGRGAAKFWLAPVELADSIDMKSNELRRARRIVDREAGEFLRRWNEYFFDA